MALSLLATYPPVDLRSSSTLLACAAAFYGFRLGSFLAIRNLVNTTKQKEVLAFEKTPRLKRIPFAVGVSLFYAFMTTPALYALRAPPATGTWASHLAYGGVATAMLGAILEAIADGHKFLVKQKYGSGLNEIFVGPTGGVYRMCRHPNYLGEVLFWAGMLLGGAPSFGKSIQAWICSLLGMYGILGIMRNATSRLDAKQAEKYKNQEAYELWRIEVKAPLMPYIH
jgi:steroid 5-alpha reductase family enzyme